MRGLYLLLNLGVVADACPSVAVMSHAIFLD